MTSLCPTCGSQISPLCVRIEARYKVGYRLVLDELPAIREVA